MAKRETTSTWRRQARRIIGNVLASLPDNTPEKTCRDHLRAAYPWGERQHHPYRMWCAEQKLALAERFPRAKEPEKKPEVAFHFWHQKRRWWLDVRCDWCRDAFRPSLGVKGCIVCGPHHAAIKALVDSPEWPGWLRDLNADPDTAPLVLADWLEEAGYPVALAELFRAEGVYPCPPIA